MMKGVATEDGEEKVVKRRRLELGGGAGRECGLALGVIYVP